jgi:hypothetical protein
MRRSLAELETILRNRICTVCSDRKVDGTCGLEDAGECALFAHLPRVAEAVYATDSNDIGDYIQAVREHVCAMCLEQNLDGSCESRKQVRCSLDAYLLLIVDAIEEATGKRFDREGLAPAPPHPGMHLSREGAL